MTEKEKMLNEELYRPEDKELTDLRMKAQLLYREYNQTSIKEAEKREQILDQLFGRIGKKLEIVPPFYCDYGFNISVGDEVFMNMNCCILDIAPITIGNQVMFGPNVQVYGATHPLNPNKRYLGEEAGKRIIIEDQVWIGGGAILCPGVRIGKGAVIAAGAIIVKDVPANTFVGGNPAKVIKTDLHLMT